MNINTCWHRKNRLLLALAGACGMVLSLPGGWADGAQVLGPWSGEQIALAGARTAWQVHLPIRFSDSIRSYHLVDGFLYAIGSDGSIHAVRADTGAYLWTRKLASMFETVWPPVSARLVTLPGKTRAEEEAPGSVLPEREPQAEKVGKARPATQAAPAAQGEPTTRPAIVQAPSVESVAFTRVRDVIFLDPMTGSQLRHDAFAVSNNAAVAASERFLFQAGPLQRFYCLAIADGFYHWQVATTGALVLAPVYVPSYDSVVVADSAGVVTAMGPERNKRFSCSLKAEPRGWLAVDGEAVYVATADKLLHAIQLASGAILWEYRLADVPAGGPVVTATSVYQATAKGGVHRIGLQRQGPNWCDAEGKRFLAEWPNRAAVLHTNGQVALWNLQSGELAERIDPGPFADGVSDPVSDSIILTTPAGAVTCIRPIGAKAVTLADFRPVSAGKHAASQPASGRRSAKQAQTQPAPAAEPMADADRTPAKSSDELLLADPLRSTRKVVP